MQIYKIILICESYALLIDGKYVILGMQTVLIILCLCLAAAVTAIVILMQRLSAARTATAVADERTNSINARLTASCTEYEQRMEHLREENTVRLEECRAQCQQRVDDTVAQCERRIQEHRNSLTDQFRNLAADTLETTVRRQQEQARQGLDAVLNPVREAFDRLAAQFNTRAMDDKADRAALREGIDTLRMLNQQVSHETRRLTSALKGNTGFQGRWGEMVLANILENSGLEPGRWLVYQESSTNEDGTRLRPDAIIHCPRKRDIIIDSKVSLTAYLRMLEADDEATRNACLEEHLRSVENHLRGLANKEYQKHIGANDAGFVLMFVPHEGAYLAAMQADVDLWQRAYDRHVVVVSPTHLVTVVRLVEQMWVTEDQTTNAVAIAEEATKMLDQLNEFLADLQGVGTALDKAHGQYESALKRLSTGRGNVLKRAERLRDLGVKTRKPLPELGD